MIFWVLFNTKYSTSLWQLFFAVCLFLLFLFLGKLTDCTERGHAKTVTNSFQGALLHGIGLYPSRKHTDMEKPRQVVIRASWEGREREAQGTSSSTGKLGWPADACWSFFLRMVHPTAPLQWTRLKSLACPGSIQHLSWIICFSDVILPYKCLYTCTMFGHFIAALQRILH